MSISTSIQTNYKINDTDLGDILVSKTYIMSTYRSFIENNTIPDAFWWGVHWPISTVIPKNTEYSYYRAVNKFPSIPKNIGSPSFIGEISDISISQGNPSGNGYTQRNMMVLMKDGTIWSCGRNSYQSLGLGNNYSYYHASTNNGSPYQIGTDNDWVHISSGNEHTMAIKRNGSLWGWGNNAFGQMGGYGNPTYAGSWGVPANMGNEIRYDDGYQTSYPYYITQWKYVACGDSFTLFIDYVGQLWSAGSNTSGKLGIGIISSSSRGYLTLVDTGPWKYVHAGEDSWIGIKENGRLYGCGELFDANSPVELGPTSGETWIHCYLNVYHWVAIRSDGTLWTGGIYNSNSSNYNSVFGQEEGASISYTSKDLYGIKALGGPYRYAACGYLSTMAIGANGKLYGWGNNQDLQIQPTFDSWIHGPIESPYSTPYTNWKLIRGTDFGYIGLRSTQYI